MNIIYRPSTHYRKGRRTGTHESLVGYVPDTIVIHYISAINVDKNDPFNVDKVLDLLTKPIDDNGKLIRVSAHYAIDRTGQVYQLVDNLDVAWHAGVSTMPDGRNYQGSCNEFSIGIELFGGNWIDFTDAQYDSLIELTNELKRRFVINEKNIVGHDAIAPGRKVDPGKRFDWKRYLSAVFPYDVQTVIEENKSQAEESEKVYTNRTDGPVPVSNISSGESPSWLKRILRWFGLT